MPEYLAPGVYIEETSFRAKTIEGVSTSTAGFVGPTRYGPIRGEPEVLTSFAAFERIYGGLDQLEYAGKKMHNYMAHAVRAFFEEGGRRLYVTRVYKGESGTATATVTAGANTINLAARYPGAAMKGVPITFTVRMGPNILGRDGDGRTVLRGAAEYDVVVLRWARPDASPPGPTTFDTQIYWLERYFDTAEQRDSFRLRQNDPEASAASAVLLSDLGTVGSPPSPPDLPSEVRILRVSVTIGAIGRFAQAQPYPDLAFHPEHTRSLTRAFAQKPTSRATALYVPLVMTTGLKNGAAIAGVILAQTGKAAADKTLLQALSDQSPTEAGMTFQVPMTGGSDGERPTAAEYEGDELAAEGTGGEAGEKSGLLAFEDLENISIVAAPGSSYGYENGYQTNADQILRLLIGHCERMRYRIGVLDPPEGYVVSQALNYRGKLDSTHAALYYPWIRITDPVTGEQINLPPSGFVTGIYARNDGQYGVHKAPANEVVRQAVGLEVLLNKGQQDVLNPEGVNCFRFFEGRGFRLWGARTISSDPEWKYVNLRRYFAYLERSIEKGTQWVVFMNNSEPLWGNVQRTVEDFLYNEWKSEHLMGTKPEEAYFVRCDRSTMTQNDIDNGRLICLIGVAPVRPAEFVIFRIGQWTADRRS